MLDQLLLEQYCETTVLSKFLYILTDFLWIKMPSLAGVLVEANAVSGPKKIGSLQDNQSNLSATLY